MTSFKRKSLKVTISILSLCIISTLYAGTKIEVADSFTSKNKTLYSNQFNFDEIKNSLWNKYLKDAQSLSALKVEYDGRALKFKDKTMRFSLEKIGVAPEGGYPLYIALHGGGQTSTAVNDSQWQHMKIYYRDSVKDGIYVATRGITDNWNLHFENESYPLYEKLIESAVLFDNVNPNRVYLLGFSAGGDGVYQVVPRMPERFAAANMSAGHHNWITFDNLYNTPFLLQVGEHDSAYKRNTVAVENYITLTQLKEKYGNGFLHDLFVHYNGSHNGWLDNDSYSRNQSILADPVAWLKVGSRHQKSINTNAIDWLKQFTRNPIPPKLIWDLSVDARERVYQTGESMLGKQNYKVKELAKPHTLFYWLDVSVADTYPENGKLVVEIVKSSNTIRVLEARNIDKFRILLNPHLLDLSQPVGVEIDNKLIGIINVKEELETMRRTLLERSDINEIYDAQITLVHNKQTQNWEIIS